MPVKIVPTVTDDPREISLTEFEQGRTNFEACYFAGDSTEDMDFRGQDFAFQFSDLNDAVTNFCTDHSIDPGIVALRFVHCYDSDLDYLYMRMQICTLVNEEEVAGRQKFQLSTIASAWYEIRNGVFTATTTDDLEDTAYLNNFYYLNVPTDPNSLQKLADYPDKFVRNITYPWESEVLLMFQDNDSPAGAEIHIASCSYNEPVIDPNVTYPHGNVMYLSVGTHDYLENGSSIVIFHNKGCDDGTPCPPNCNVYINPVLPEA
jgi:hypothetical protein